MKAAKWRLIVAAVLFVAWLGYLLTLAIVSVHPVVHLWPFQVTKTPPVILSRPQFLDSSFDVIADVSAQEDGRPSPEVAVREVHWPRDGTNPEKITVVNLLELSPVEGRQIPVHGWEGPGPYILALAPVGKEGQERAYRVVPTPPSPGFEGRPPRIYRVDSQTRQQLEEIEANGKP
jgi:hypothetical protein